MSALLRIWWTFFTAYPVQRVVACIGIALFAFGAGFGPLFKPAGRSAAELIGMLGLATVATFVLLPAAFLAGALFRELSSPRPHRLLPHFRVRMLAALLLLVGCVVLPLYVSVELTVPARGTSGSIDANLVSPTVFVSCLVLGLFFASRSLQWASIVLLSGGAFALWVSRGGATHPAASGTDLPFWSAIATALVWLMFGIWYLRARSIRPPGMSLFSFDAMMGPEAQTAAMSSRVSSRTDFAPDEALSMWLWGGPRFPLTRQVPGMLLVVAILLLVVLFVLTPLIGQPQMQLFGAVIIVVASPTLFLHVNRFARRSRYLWLRLESRSAVFRATQRLAVRHCAPAALQALCLAAGVPLVIQDLSYPQSFAVFGIALSGGAYAFYTGLAAVRGGYAVWGAAMAVLLASQGMAIWAILAEPFRTGWFGGVVVFHLLTAASLRQLAVRHWRQIDWLRISPSTNAFQSRRSA